MSQLTLVWVKCVSPSSSLSGAAVVAVTAGATVLGVAAAGAAIVLTAGAATPAVVAAGVAGEGALAGLAGAAVLPEVAEGVVAAAAAGTAAVAVGTVAAPVEGVVAGVAASTGCKVAIAAFAAGIATGAGTASAAVGAVDSGSGFNDDLYLKYWLEGQEGDEGTRVPDGDDTLDLDAGATAELGIEIQLDRMVEIKLYDQDTISEDDDLGGLRIYPDVPVGRYTATIVSEEGSAYDLMYVIKS